MEEVKKSIYFTVAQICTQESIVDFGKSYLGEDVHFEITDDAIATMCELVLGYSDCMARDLEAFSAHAKRTTINPSDVRLVARRQPSIQTRLDEMTTSLEENKKKRKKKGDGSTSS